MPAPKKNQYGAKPPGTHKSNKGRIIADLGDLKTRCVRAANTRGMKFVAWVREHLERAARDEGF